MFRSINSFKNLPEDSRLVFMSPNPEAQRGQEVPADYMREVSPKEASQMAEHYSDLVDEQFNALLEDNRDIVNNEDLGLTKAEVLRGNPAQVAEQYGLSTKIVSAMRDMLQIQAQLNSARRVNSEQIASVEDRLATAATVLNANSEGGDPLRGSLGVIGRDFGHVREEIQATRRASAKETREVGRASLADMLQDFKHLTELKRDKRGEIVIILPDDVSPNSSEARQIIAKTRADYAKQERELARNITGQLKKIPNGNYTIIDKAAGITAQRSQSGNEYMIVMRLPDEDRPGQLARPGNNYSYQIGSGGVFNLSSSELDKRAA